MTTNQDVLVRAFRDSAVRYGDAIERGDSRAASKAAKEGRTIRDALTAAGSAGVSVLEEILEDSNLWVQYAVASSILEWNTDSALQVLDRLQAHSGAIGAAAFTVLKMWQTRSQSN